MDPSPISPMPHSETTSSSTYNFLGSNVLLLATLLLLLRLYRDYLIFLALGPGGTPNTLAGFLRIKILGLFALRDPYQPAPIPKRFRGAPGYLTNVPARKLPRPQTRGIAPHRQTTHRASTATFNKLSAGLEALAATNPNLTLGTSCFEKHGTGLFSISSAKRTCRGEICHAHALDGSMHLTLHPADAKLVLEAGWGERHPIARGGWFERFVPAGFMMVYAPANEREIELVLEIVKAAAWFVSGGESVKGVPEVRRDSGFASADVSPGVNGRECEVGAEMCGE